jgi:hypothetical protein
VIDKVAKEPAAEESAELLANGDGANPPPPHCGPHSLASSTQPGPAAEVCDSPVLCESGLSSQSP